MPLYHWYVMPFMQHQSNRSVTVIDINVSNEEDAVKALQQPSTKCVCLTNMELASHQLLQLVAHREEPLQEQGTVL